MTLENVTVDCRDSAQCAYAVSNNHGNITIKGNTNIYAKSGYQAFDLWYGMSSAYDDGVNVTVDTTGTIQGIIEYGAKSRITGKDWTSKAKLEIKNGNFVGKFIASSAQITIDEANIVISGGTFSGDVTAFVALDHEYIQESDKYVVQEKAQGSGLTAEASASADGKTASAVVEGFYAGNNADKGVTTEGGTLSVTATTGTSDGANDTVTKTEVAISPKALETVNNNASVQNVEIKTDVADVTVDAQAWGAITDNAENSSVTIGVEKKTETGGQTVYVLTAEDEAGNNVFDESVAAGTITVSVPYSGTNPKVYYVGENGLVAMTSTYVDGKLSWSVEHFSEYVILEDGKEAAVKKSNGTFVQYDTLAAAIEAASAGETVILGKNVTVDVPADTPQKNGALNINKNLIIDGNGFTITANNGEGTGFTQDENKVGLFHVINVTGGTVTIKNLTIDGNHVARHGVHVFTVNSAGTKTTVTLKNVTSKNNTGYGVVSGGSDLTVTGITTEGNVWGGINVDNTNSSAAGGSFTMNSGTINEANSVFIENSKSSVVGSAPAATIENGTFKGEVAIADGGGTGVDVVGPSLVVQGGTFSNSVADYIAGSLKVELESGNEYKYFDSVAKAMEAAKNDPNATIKQVKNGNAPVGTTHTVTINNNNGSNNKTMIVAEGTKIDVADLATPTRSGYRFRGWTVNGEYVSTVEVTGNVEIAASWKKKSSDSDSGSSSSEKENTVSVADKAENGKVKVDPSKAAKGDKVTITVTPDKGYVIDKVTVKDADGNKLELKDKGNGEYTFTMPDSKVEIKATFVKESEKVEETVKPEEVPAAEKIVLTVSQRVANVFGEPVVNDVAPIIRNDRTMLPIRFIAEALGATVAWDDALNKVTITKGDDVIDIYIGSAVAFVNGNPIDLDSPAFIENSRTYLPLRFVAENLGADVYWNAEAQEVTVVPQK